MFVARTLSLFLPLLVPQALAVVVRESLQSLQRWQGPSHGFPGFGALGSDPLWLEGMKASLTLTHSMVTFPYRLHLFLQEEDWV